MFRTTHNQASALQRLQDLAAIHRAAKHRAEQLRREAMDAFFQNIGVSIRKVVTLVFKLGK